jgi:hypothetical protein
VKPLPRAVALLMDIALAPLLLCAIVWVSARQRAILRGGEALSDEQLAIARALGVAAAERVRVIAEAEVPMPLPRWARLAAQRAGVLSPHIVGMTLGYGIVLRADCCGNSCSNRRLLAHELMHVAQYERLGGLCGIGGFLRQYLRECLWPGYPRSALEIEARAAELRYARCARYVPCVKPGRM